jgi:peroxiredoxin
LQGITKTLADYVGQAVALLFVSPTCQPCRERLPMLQKAAVEARASGVEFVLVSDGSLEETRTWHQEVDVQLPVLIATRGQNPFFQDYQITSTPTFCLLGPDGKVRGTGIIGLNFERWKLLANPRILIEQ